MEKLLKMMSLLHHLGLQGLLSTDLSLANTVLTVTFTLEEILLSRGPQTAGCADGEGTEMLFYNTLLRFHFFVPKEELKTIATVPIL